MSDDLSGDMLAPSWPNLVVHILTTFVSLYLDINSTSKMVTASLDGEDNGAGPVMNPNEVMTSRAITIRDPETGAIYVQTQLLQVSLMTFYRLTRVLVICCALH